MKRARRRGFTLIELMVSLIAGTIIAIAVVGLARTATLAFHEQVRLQTVEEEIRTASNRLRYDLTKISFMGTGNINTAFLAQGLLPPQQGTPYGHHVAQFGGPPGQRYPGATTNLQGIQITVNGSQATTQGSQGYATANNLSPDSIQITGNLTTDDEYIGTWNPSGGGCGGGLVTIMSSQDPANARLVNGNAQNVVNAFQPGGSGTFLVRITDQVGCQHFVTTNAVTAVSIGTPVEAAQISLCTGTDGYSVLPVGSNTSGCGVQPLQQIRISPLHKVKWFLAQNADPNINAPAPAGGLDAQFMLYRQILDAFGNPLPPAAGSPLPATQQVVAEYAIDLKFGISVDNYGTMQFFDLDTDLGAGNIMQWTQTASTTIVGGPGPQRVRSVRYRLSVRAPIPDRTADLKPLPGTPYIVRYCVNPADGCTRFSRVRTIVSEVPLINQARMTY